jgi:lysozyme family protein
MANVQHANTALVKKWEGGLSKNKKDPADKFPRPANLEFHTNMGITWETFSTNAQKLGYAADPDLFVKMPDDIWLKIYKKLFWDSVKGDDINSQAIAEFMTEWAWGSGPGTAAKKLQEYINTHRTENLLKVDGKIGTKTIGALHEIIRKKGERIVFEDLDRAKRNFLNTLSSINLFGVGWYHRMDEFRNYAVQIIPA